MSIQKRARSPKRSRTRTEHRAATQHGACDTAIAVSPDVLPAKKSGRHFAFLIAVDQTREKTRAYAVMAPSAKAALEHMSTQALVDVSVSLVGRLSLDMAKRLKLKPGELLLLSA